MTQTLFESTLQRETPNSDNTTTVWNYLNEPAKLSGTAFKPEDSMHPDCLLFCENPSDSDLSFVSFSVACKGLWSKKKAKNLSQATKSAIQTDPNRFYYTNCGKTMKELLTPPPIKEPEADEVLYMMV